MEFMGELKMKVERTFGCYIVAGMFYFSPAGAISQRGREKESIKIRACCSEKSLETRFHISKISSFPTRKL